MFTGIIKKTAKIGSIKKQADGLVVQIPAPTGWKIEEGQSVSVNGICSTVAAIRGKRLTLQYMPETIRKTTVRWWKTGNIVNLEQSLRFGDSIDGHIVTGHIEGFGRISAAVHEKGDLLFKIETSRELISHMLKKGSIALNGVSLTLADVGDDWFAIALIPYTVSHTSWKERKVGDMVNIETDILGRQRAASIFKHAKKNKRKG